MSAHPIISELVEWREKNVVRYKQIISNLQGKIQGRICYSKNLYTLIFLKQFLGDQFKVYVEIGSLFGASLAMMMQDDIKRQATFIGIDLFDGYYGNKPDPVTHIKPTLEIVRENIKKTNKYNQNHILIKGSSYHPTTISTFDNLNLKIDLLFIDGDHSYYGATIDFLSYFPYLNQGAFVVFDNYSDWPGVKEAVKNLNFEELKCEVIGGFKSGYIVRKL